MIRLLDAKKIVTCNDYRHPTKKERELQQTTPYIILSHVWIGDEVGYVNMENFRRIRTSPFADQSESKKVEHFEGYKHSLHGDHGG